MLSFIRGGYYADIDAACLAGTDHWYQNISYFVPESDQFLPSSEMEVIPPINFIVAMKNGSNSAGRVMSFVTSSYAAKAGHPILMDVIHRTYLRTNEQMRRYNAYVAEQQAQSGWIQYINNEFNGLGGFHPYDRRNYPESGDEFHVNAVQYNMFDLQQGLGGFDEFDWAGIGSWTDSILAYLWANWQVNFDHILNIRKPSQIGDVLILPRGMMELSAGYKDSKLVVAPELPPLNK